MQCCGVSGGRLSQSQNAVESLLWCIMFWIQCNVTDKADVQYIVDLLEDDSTNHLTQMKVTFVRIMARIDARLSRNRPLLPHQYDLSHVR